MSEKGEAIIVMTLYYPKSAPLAVKIVTIKLGGHSEGYWTYKHALPPLYQKSISPWVQKI